MWLHHAPLPYFTLFADGNVAFGHGQTQLFADLLIVLCGRSTGVLDGHFADLSFALQALGAPLTGVSPQLSTTAALLATVLSVGT